MSIKVVTEPEEEPIDLPLAKAQCRIDISDDDALLQHYIRSARRHIEAITNRALLTQTLDLYLDDWPASDLIELKRSPVQSVTSIKYVDSLGVTHTFSNSNYLVDSITEPARIVLKSSASWPTDTLQDINGVIVRFVAGWDDPKKVSAPIVQALLMLVGDFYEHREASIDGAVSREVEFAVTNLLRNERVMKF